MVVGERRDVSYRARGKGVGGERPDVTDSLKKKEVGG